MVTAVSPRLECHALAHAPSAKSYDVRMADQDLSIDAERRLAETLIEAFT